MQSTSQSRDQVTELEPKRKDEMKPYRVIHKPTGDLLKGFDEMPSAEQDARDRNTRAKELEISARYQACEK